MTARGEVWDLLVSREGQWLTREDVERVGGHESMRRLRELKTAALGAGYVLEQRQTIGNLLEYRLYRMKDERSPWICTKCGAHGWADNLQPSTDGRDRYRLGPCAVCKNNHAIFRKETP